MLSYYWDTPGPDSVQLRRADQFFLAYPPHLLYSTAKFRTVNVGVLPEVAFLGRSNVGKSSLLNALMGRSMCHTSSKPGRTKTMNFFAVGGPDEAGSLGKIVVLDMPGYGKGSREEWGPEILKYLVGRKQYARLYANIWKLELTCYRLRRAFLLVDALHGLKPSDEELLRLFRKNAISHQIILSKVDRVLWRGPRSPSESKLGDNSIDLLKLCEKLRTQVQPGICDGPESLGEIVSCSAEKSLEMGKKIGIDRVRWAVLAATGLGAKKRKLLPSEIDNDNPEQMLAQHMVSHESRTNPVDDERVALPNYQALRIQSYT